MKTKKREKLMFWFSGYIFTLARDATLLLLMDTCIKIRRTCVLKWYGFRFSSLSPSLFLRVYVYFSLSPLTRADRMTEILQDSSVQWARAMNSVKRQRRHNSIGIDERFMLMHCMSFTSFLAACSEQGPARETFNCKTLNEFYPQ